MEKAQEDCCKCRFSGTVFSHNCQGVSLVNCEIKALQPQCTVVIGVVIIFHLDKRSGAVCIIIFLRAMRCFCDSMNMRVVVDMPTTAIAKTEIKAMFPQGLLV